MKKNIIILVSAVLLLTAGGVGYWFVSTQLLSSPVTSSDYFDEVLTTYSAANLENVDVLFGETMTASDRVMADGNIVTIQQGGEYVISGSTENGQVVVDAGEDEVTLVLNGANITNQAGAAIFIKASGDVEVYLAKNSVNRLVDGVAYTPTSDEEEQTAPLYSKSDLEIDGGNNSVLNIIGNYNDGIVSKDDLDIKDVTVNVKSVDDGLRGKDSVEIKDSVITIVAQGDGIKSDNADEAERGVITIENSELTIAAGVDGISGVNAVEILSGAITITEAFEGIEGKKIIVHDGIIDITSYDDALNVSETEEDVSAVTKLIQRVTGGGGTERVVVGGELNIYGGTISLSSNYGDAFDSNGNAMMTGGSLIIHGPLQGGAPVDVNGEFLVSQGTVIAAGYSNRAQTPSASSTQLSLQVNFEEVQEPGTVLSLQDATGTEVFTFRPIKIFRSVMYSSADLVQGGTYSLLVDGEAYANLTLNETITTHGQIRQAGNR